jgi:hypothetical protein
MSQRNIMVDIHWSNIRSIDFCYNTHSLCFRDIQVCTARFVSCLANKQPNFHHANSIKSVTVEASLSFQFTSLQLSSALPFTCTSTLHFNLFLKILYHITALSSTSRCPFNCFHSPWLATSVNFAGTKT